MSKLVRLILATSLSTATLVGCSKSTNTQPVGEYATCRDDLDYLIKELIRNISEQGTGELAVQLPKSYQGVSKEKAKCLDGGISEVSNHRFVYNEVIGYSLWPKHIVNSIK